MKKSSLSFLILSLPAVAVLFPYSVANAGLRISNDSMIKSQAAMNASARASAAQAMAPQPARVVTNDDGETVTISDETMDACSKVYPGGVFDWAKPTSGIKRGGNATCVALVELRNYKNSVSTEYNVLATTYLAAGDSMKCNIDDFAEVTPFGKGYEYPADNPPTIEDVEKAMVQENKSGAGWKILGAALVGGIGGNLVGKGDAGSDSMFGTNSEKLKTTAIGAVGGAALMTASTQVNDYKAGSVILSTGVNAAAGAVAGNLLATGDDVLKIDKCDLVTGQDEKGKDVKVSKYCLYGALDKDAENGQKYSFDTPGENDKDTIQQNMFYDIKSGVTYFCSSTDDSDKFKNCWRTELTKIVFEDMTASDCQGFLDKDTKTTYDSVTGFSQDCKNKLRELHNTSRYAYQERAKDDKEENKILEKNNNTGTFIKIKTASAAGNRVSAKIEVTDAAMKKMFGYTYADWMAGKLDKDGVFKNKEKLYDYQGKEIIGANVDKFHPAMQSVDDSDTIDFNNKARTKSTLIGAGAGAGLGALSGAAGADTEIQQRWVTAVQEYKDSLKNVSCSTGNKYLAPYNDIVILPAMKVSE